MHCANRTLNIILLTLFLIASLANSNRANGDTTIGEQAIGEQAIGEQAIASADETDDQMSEAAAPFALDEDGKLIQFGRDIAPIFRKNCLDCHGPDDAKADFRIDDRDAVLDYIEPEEADDSTLYIDYLTIDDEDMLMPPRSHGGPLDPNELALIRVWINEGADWPEDAKLDPSEVADTDIAASEETKSIVGRVWAAQGFLHPATVHFPIALLLLGAAFVVLGWKWPAVGTQIPLACLLIGALTSIAATAMGWSFAVEQGYGSWNRFDAEMMDREVFWHRWSGLIVTVLSVVFALIALSAIKNPSDRKTTIWKAGLLVCAAIVGAVGHQGGEMSYGEDFYPKAFRTLMGISESDTASNTDPPEGI